MSRLSCTISEISDILLENRDYSIAINLLKLADYFKEEEDSPRGKPSRILSRFFFATKPSAWPTWGQLTDGSPVERSL